MNKVEQNQNNLNEDAVIKCANALEKMIDAKQAYKDSMMNYIEVCRKNGQSDMCIYKVLDSVATSYTRSEEE